MDSPSASRTAQVGSSPLHGRGLIAASELRTGYLIGIYPLLILSAEDTAKLKGTRLYHYVFYVDETASGAMRAAVAFGDISMCNHSSDANAFFEIDADLMEVRLFAERRIAVGEEILIDYEDFAEEAL